LQFAVFSLQGRLVGVAQFGRGLRQIEALVAGQRVLLQTRPTESSGRAANPSDRVIRADCKLVMPFSTALDFLIKKKKAKTEIKAIALEALCKYFG
jgi:hypothetical protein